ncbi:hypothetical protein PFICI_12527 [Pestalotiopsis fici W106-1]|uniref:Uncharacterized protein n=1 Tax=Pestalotiopsis fici (strain W106-1 / CGMCC3.15140) TaxID=1229662 RepID=W3WNZ7_PESFW|nr:uncharacterized protein PFICI_12527 [Pestalotiopsis fici W106-1]ETS75583.1 hypothetical protein PFICI_12527 [Pestalotiopsis fici W106-1]
MEPALIKSGAPSFRRRLLYTILYYVQIAIRLFRLHVLRYWLHPREKPKVALYHDRGVALIQSVIHLVPLSVVVAFIVINIKSWYWGDASSTVLTTLQFAAKALEILMQTSLGMILMSFIRSQLFGDSGLPLGSLLGPYSVNDVAYLWSLEFWGGLVSKHARIGQRLVIGLVIAALIILASLVGPSIAVLLIPRPIDYVTGRYLQLLDGQATIFPEQVHLQGGNLKNEGAFRDALYQLLQNRDQDFKFIDQYNMGRIMPSAANTPVLPPSDSSSGPTSEDRGWYVGTLGATLVSMAMHFPNWHIVGKSLKSIYAIPIKDSLRTTTFQTYVKVICQSRYWSKIWKEDYAAFGDIGPEVTNITFADLDEIMYSAGPDNDGMEYGIAWFAAPLQASNHSILMARGSRPVTDPLSQNHTVDTCTIDAVWLKTNMNSAADRNSEIVINSELLPADRQQFGYQPIKIPADWASRVVDIFLESQSHVTDMQTEKVFALALANAAPIPHHAFGPQPVGWKDCPSLCWGQPLEWLDMSQTQYDAAKAYLDSNEDILSKHNDVFFYTTSNWSDPESLYHLEVETYLHGYGYDSSRVPVILSLIVLSIYAFVVIIHLLYTFVTGSVGRSWDTLAELLLLGLHSQPPGVAATSNTTVGIETMAPFEEPVGGARTS